MPAELLILGFGTGGDAVGIRAEWREVATALTGRKNIAALGFGKNGAAGPRPAKANI